MKIRAMKKIGYKEGEGDLYKKLIVANPEEELRLFISGDKYYYVARAVRNYAGIIIKYEKVSDYFDNFEKARQYRLFLINSYRKGEYDYYIVDYLQDDDQYLYV